VIPTAKPTANVAQAVYFNQGGVAFCITMVGMTDPAKATAIKILRIFIG
jgi:hypothetical protein